MPKQKLTNHFVKTVKLEEGCQKREFFDTDFTGLMLEVRPARKTFYLKCRDSHGDQRQPRLGRADVLTVKDAKDKARAILRDIEMGIDPSEEKRLKREIPTVRGFVQDHYMPHIKGYKRSWDTDECLLRNHILPAIGELHLDQVKRSHMVALFSHHRQTHRPGSTNRIIILCRYIFNCAIRWEIAGAEKNPTTGIDLYEENNQRERYLTEEESQRLFAELDRSQNKALKYIIALLLLTGARKREVLDAQWRDFDFEQGIWTIEKNKTGKPRHIPISEALIALLGLIPKHEDCRWVVPNPNTLKPYASIFGAWNTARKKAGLDDLRIHDLRHSFASFLINSGRSLYEVQKILGHTQVKTTQRYAHLTKDTLKEAANEAAKSVPLVQALPQSTGEVALLGVDTKQ